MRPPTASIGKPEGMDRTKAPLPAMAMTAQDDFNGMVGFQEIEHDRSMGQHDRVTAWNTMRDARDIGAMSGRIVESHHTQLSTGKRDDDRLVDQEMQFVAIGELDKVCDRHATVMIVIAKCHTHRRETSEMTQKPEQMRQAVGHIEKIPGDKNPIGAQFRDRLYEYIMARQVIVQVQVADLDRPSSLQWFKRRF